MIDYERFPNSGSLVVNQVFVSDVSRNKNNASLLGIGVFGAVMETINFSGIEGEVIESSPHGNYLVVRLSDRITICGTFSNQWNWQEATDVSSGFESFITYIGVGSISDAKLIERIVIKVGGYFYSKEQQPRKSKRVSAFPLELKVRGLTPEFIHQIVSQSASNPTQAFVNNCFGS